MCSCKHCSNRTTKDAIHTGIRFQQYVSTSIWNQRNGLKYYFYSPRIVSGTKHWVWDTRIKPPHVALCATGKQERQTTIFSFQFLCTPWFDLSFKISLKYITACGCNVTKCKEKFKWSHNLCKMLCLSFPDVYKTHGCWISK